MVVKYKDTHPLHQFPHLWFSTVLSSFLSPGEPTRVCSPQIPGCWAMQEKNDKTVHSSAPPECWFPTWAGVSELLHNSLFVPSQFPFSLPSFHSSRYFTTCNLPSTLPSQFLALPLFFTEKPEAREMVFPSLHLCQNPAMTFQRLFSLAPDALLQGLIVSITPAFYICHFPTARRHAFAVLI